MGLAWHTLGVQCFFFFFFPLLLITAVVIHVALTNPSYLVLVIKCLTLPLVIDSQY